MMTSFRSTAALVTALGLLPVAAKADRPPRPATTYKAEAPGGRFYAEVNHPQKRITVFENRQGTAVPRYRIPEWRPVVFLSPDGSAVAIGYDGSNLLAPGVTSEEPLITFYLNGAKASTVKLREVFPDLSLLRKTTSHWAWGEFWGFTEENLFRVKTVDGRILSFDPATGEIQRSR